METSALYKEIVSDPLHAEENKIIIDDREYTEQEIDSTETSYGAFGGTEVTIGAAVMGSCTVVLRRDGIRAAQLSSEIGRGARVRPYVRVIDSAGRASEWLQQGDYNVDTRDATAWSSKLTLSCVDKMQRAEADYPSTSHEWPYMDILVVEEIASAMGVEIDPATYAVMISGNMIPLPSSYSMRETLGYIAVMYGGNFIMTKKGKLLLLTLNSLAQETNNLVTAQGQRITVGGVGILV